MQKCKLSSSWNFKRFCCKCWNEFIFTKIQHCILPFQKCFGPSKSLKIRFKLSDICVRSQIFFFCFKIDFFVVHFFFLEGISMFTFVGYTCEITIVCFFKLWWSHTNSCDLKVFWWDHPWFLWVISLQKGLQFVSPYGNDVLKGSHWNVIWNM